MTTEHTLGKRSFFGPVGGRGPDGALSSGDRIGLEPKTAEALANEDSDEVKRIRSTCIRCPTPTRARTSLRLPKTCESNFKEHR